MNVGFISLGCSKNLVDTEMTIGLFKNHNYNIVTTPVNADVIVINTCGFIASAKEEAINTILEMANYKKNRCKYLIVMGCLVQRYKEDLEKAIPEVDLWIKYNEYNTIWEQIENVIAPLDKSNNYNCPEELNFLDRVVSTGKNYAYLRIAEGCSIHCTYCAITDELIQTVKNNDKICKYFDIPIQHISNSVLKKMNRKSNGESIRNLLAKIRKEIPSVILRTTVIVGFPGETKEDFEELYNFIKDVKFDRLGAFSYSKEEGTPASRLPDQIHPMTKKSRYNKIMKLQQEIAAEKLKSQVGKELEVLIETKTFDSKYYAGRSYMDVPDIDGLIYIKNENKEDLENQFIKCKITDVKGYDLIAQI